jgi:hypothetical protein
VARSLSPHLLLVLAVFLVGCDLLSARHVRTPSVSGVVEDVTRLPDGGVTYGLDSGESVVIPSQKHVLLGGEPLVGELLLSGEDPDGSRWVAGVGQNPNESNSGCFWLTTNGHDAGDGIETSDGFRLPRAERLDPGIARRGEYSSPHGYFCLNNKGEVTSYVSA